MGPRAKVGSSFPFFAVQGISCLFVFSQLAWQRGGVWNKPPPPPLLPPAPTGMRAAGEAACTVCQENHSWVLFHFQSFLTQFCMQMPQMQWESCNRGRFAFSLRLASPSTEQGKRPWSLFGIRLQRWFSFLGRGHDLFF